MRKTIPATVLMLMPTKTNNYSQFKSNTYPKSKSPDTFQVKMKLRANRLHTPEKSSLPEEMPEYHIFIDRHDIFL
jgi:hypothetical protein